MSIRAKHIVYAAGIILFIALPQLITVKYYLHLSILALIWVITAQGQNLIQGYCCVPGKLGHEVLEFSAD